MRRQFLVFIFASIVSWYGMMFFHELGHVLGALVTGGTVTSVNVPLFGFSLTRYGTNSHPLLVAWAGPVGGALLSLLLFGMSRHTKGLRNQALLYFSGFSLIANGVYIGVGGFYNVGDCAVLLINGARLWQLVAFGLIATCLGGFCWHRMGPTGEWFRAATHVDEEAE